MPNASQLTPENRFVGLFVGPSKHGKTVAACSFPGPVKVLDFDGRIRGLLGAPWLADKLKDIDYEYYPPKTDPNKPPTYQKLNSDLEALQLMCAQGQNQYKTLLVDSLTSECFALLCDAVSLTHAKDKGGKKIGSMNMAGPEDYGFEATGTYNLMAFLRSLPIPNIIVTAHVVDKFGKADPNDRYSENIVVGEKLSLRDKISENVQLYFDHTFRFDKQGERHFVKFRGDLASTSYKDLPSGSIDVTGKNFYELMMQYIKQGK